MACMHMHAYYIIATVQYTGMHTHTYSTVYCQWQTGKLQGLPGLHICASA